MVLVGNGHAAKRRCQVFKIHIVRERCIDQCIGLVEADVGIDYHQEIAAWILHGGGRDVLLALRRRLVLPEESLRWSSSVLRELGNISSPFVIHVLERACLGGAPPGWWWLSSFGAGFSSRGALLHVR